VLVRTAGSILFRRGNFSFLSAIAFMSVVDAETLAPIRAEQHNPDGSGEKWNVNGAHVEWREQSKDPQAKEVVHQFDLPAAAYDIGGAALPLYFAAQRLKQSYSGVIPVIGDPEHPLRGLPFKVLRREKVRAGARGMVDAWVVECPDPTAGTLHFWYSNQLPFPIKMDIPASPGVPRTVYEMIG
jgi:hypothetical protein